MKSSLFIFTPCLPHHCHRVHRDKAKELVCWSLGSRQTQVQERFTLVPYLPGTTCCCLSFSHFKATFTKHLKTNIFDLYFPHRHLNAWWIVNITEQRLVILLHKYFVVVHSKIIRFNFPWLFWLKVQWFSLTITQSFNVSLRKMYWWVIFHWFSLSFFYQSHFIRPPFCV